MSTLFSLFRGGDEGEFRVSDSAGGPGGRRDRAVRYARHAARPVASRGGRFRAQVEGLEARWVPAISLPANFSATLVTAGLAGPTAMAFAPDGRLFVDQQQGQVRIIKNGALLPTPFLSLNVDSSGERGLLGIAFDPNFATNHFVYVYYTVATAPVHNRVSRFTANGDVAVPGSEVDLLDLNNLSAATNHNGGALHFGIDGKLYITTGDNANGNNSQTLSNLLGKVLRINPDGSIPADNPFFNTATGANRAIWALGLRNPFTFAVQPVTGRIFINDVGQSTWEEIDDGVAGSNYGWPITEGPTTDPRFRGPLFAYGHGQGNTLGAAIVGGVFYNPATIQFPTSFVNKYFFEDLTNGWIRTFDSVTGQAAQFATGIDGLLVDLLVDPQGSLYFLEHQDNTQGGNGSVYKITFTPPPPPPPPPPPTPFLSLYRPATAQWLSTGPGFGVISTSFGAPGVDVPVPGDYDGDGRPDFAVYRPSTAQWFIQQSTAGPKVVSFGQPGVDLPVPADYDGDHRTDLAVFRPTTDQWFLLESTAGPVARQFGQANVDLPVPGDYDGDGKADIAVYRPFNSTWFVSQSAAGPLVRQFGASNQDLPIPADFDHDGKTDLAVFRPATALWQWFDGTGTTHSTTLGNPGTDIPVTGDFDGDGVLDLGAYHPATATWSLLQSRNGAQTFTFGLPGIDVPLMPPLVFRYRGALSRLLSANQALREPSPGERTHWAPPGG